MKTCLTKRQTFIWTTLRDYSDSRLRKIGFLNLAREHKDDNHKGQHVSDRLRPDKTVDTDDCLHDKHGGDENDALTENGREQRRRGRANCLQRVLADCKRADQPCGAHQDARKMHTGIQCGQIGQEDLDNRLCEQVAQKRNHRAENQSEQSRKADALDKPILFLRAVAIAKEGLHAAADSDANQRDNHDDLRGDAVSGNQHVAAVILRQLGVHND